jgi:hypothetical protein
MYLQYGVDVHGELVYVDQVSRGLSSLKCPYCAGELVAKKGQIKAHHFAHAGQTCHPVARNDDIVALPAYDNFNLHLTGKAVQQLRNFAANIGDYEEAFLESQEVIQYNEWKGARGGYELTKKGKLVLGQLSLLLFNEFQEPLIQERYQALEARAREAYGQQQSDVISRTQVRIAQLEPRMADLYQAVAGYRATDGGPELWAKQREFYELTTELKELRAITAKAVDLNTALTDLRLYRTQWRRILSCTLYCLSINQGHLYKIGVTTRPIQERLAEIQKDLKAHLGQVNFEVVGSWPHRGNVELYFKYRYAPFVHRLGTLTEYFKFEDARAVLRDLRRMKPKVLTELEQAILTGEPSQVEHQIYADAVEQRRRQAIRTGMHRAAARGRNIGRPEGIESAEAFLAKPHIQRVQEALRMGLSVRRAAHFATVSPNTVRKVQSLLKQGKEAQD